MTISDTSRAAWRNVAHLALPPNARRDPALFAAWQAWRTSQGDCGETAMRRLLTLPDAARDVYHELVEFFLAGGRLDPQGRPVEAWERAC